MNTDLIKNNILSLIDKETDESVLLAVKKILEDNTLKNIYEQRSKLAEADIEANRLYDVDEIRYLTDSDLNNQ